MNLSTVRRRRWAGFPKRVRAEASARVGQRPPSRTVDDRALQSERSRFAAGIDRELRLACRSEMMMRRELGIVAGVFVGRRMYRRLGFVRLSDYARERLGISGRTLQAASWLAARLDELPAVSRAYDRSELSWAQARAVCKVAAAADEEQWLDVARRTTVEELERLAKAARPQAGVPVDPEAAGDEIDGEPTIRWRLACPSRVRAVWRRAVELASRVAGAPLATWEAAEIIAAEGFSGRPSDTSVGDRALIEAIRLARRTRRDGNAAEPPAPSALPDDVVAAPAVAPPDPAPAPIDDSPIDAFALDARLDDAMRVIRTAEPRIGRFLRVVVDHKLYRALGYARLDDYVRERLGFSMRKVRALTKVERATGRSDDFARAYREGHLSWVQALTLLPVLDRANGAAWVARADSVTVRRLGDEVGWVLEARDVSGSAASLTPPPLDSRLTSPVAPLMKRCRGLSPTCEVQIGARSAEPLTDRPSLMTATLDAARSEIVDAEVTFVAPASVIALLRDVLDAFAPPGAPRWKAFERLLHHVVHHWESTPRHSDPIFARDGWRCTVPGCSSRRNLHDHHIKFRSRGGLNTRDNRTAVCVAHHLHGLHDGTIRASGPAPSAIEWQLGVRSGAPPFATYVGDRRCRPPGDGESGRAALGSL